MAGSLPFSRMWPSCPVWKIPRAVRENLASKVSNLRPENWKIKITKNNGDVSAHHFDCCGLGRGDVSLDVERCDGAPIEAAAGVAAQRYRVLCALQHGQLCLYSLTCLCALWVHWPDQTSPFCSWATRPRLPCAVLALRERFLGVH